MCCNTKRNKITQNEEEGGSSPALEWFSEKTNGSERDLTWCRWGGGVFRGITVDVVGTGNDGGRSRPKRACPRRGEGERVRGRKP